MINYTVSHSSEELAGILELQRKNLRANLSQEEILTQGFVTVLHNMDDLRKMNEIEEHVIAKDGEKVVAYLLAMTSRSGNDIPALVPMFKLFEQIIFSGVSLAARNYIVIGQACVEKAYRGKGVFDGIYNYYRTRFKDKYDFAVTEIATSNARSIRAHERVGFKSIHQYIAPDKIEWSIVVLDWR